MEASEPHLYQRIVLPRKLATGSIHDYLFCYCPLVGILFKVLRIEIKQRNKGIIINGECVSILMYVDYISLLTSLERDLQEMLHVLKSWFDKWHMSLNTDITQIVHFRTQSHSRTQYVFRYGDYDIKLVPLYKYLRLGLNRHLDYQLMAKVVAKSTNRALGLLIAKSKVTSGMTYDVFTLLYNALIQPMIDYGVGIWGTGNFSYIKSVLYKACHFFFGVGKYTPNTAIEMVWKFPQRRIGLCVTCLWCRMMNMSTDRLNSRVFKWANMQNEKNWNSRIKPFFTELEVGHLNYIEPTTNQPAVMEYMNTILGDYYEKVWWEALQRQEAWS